MHLHRNLGHSFEFSLWQRRQLTYTSSNNDTQKMTIYTTYRTPQHTSNLQEGNAVVWCIPATRKLRSAAACSRGAKPHSPPRPLLGVWQHTMALRYITPPEGGKKHTKNTQIIPQRKTTQVYHPCPRTLLLGHMAPSCVKREAAASWCYCCGSAGTKQNKKNADRVVRAVQTASVRRSLPRSARLPEASVSYYRRWGIGSARRDDLMRTTRAPSAHGNHPLEPAGAEPRGLLWWTGASEVYVMLRREREKKEK